MLELNYGAASEKIIVTLGELETLDEPNYLFIFTHTLTKQQIVFIKLNSDDESEYKSRYNKFNITTVSTFLNKPIGEWLYEIYEQVSNLNTDPDLATSLLEFGKMILYSAVEFEREMYENQTSFKTYQG
jgi:hypothetical protein